MIIRRAMPSSRSGLDKCIASSVNSCAGHAAGPCYLNSARATTMYWPALLDNKHPCQGRSGMQNCMDERVHQLAIPDTAAMTG